MLFESVAANAAARCDDCNTVAEAVRVVRGCLQFNDAPSYEMMTAGEVDCVAAAVITQRVLSSLWPNEIFDVVLLPLLPWLPTRFNDSRHCGVLWRRDGAAALIDPTPINGYGYGRVGQFMSLDAWSSVVALPPTENMAYWEQRLYPSWVPLSSGDLEAIFDINNVRNALLLGNPFKDPQQLPANSTGWSKEYWRVLARGARLRRRHSEARFFYGKALSVSPHNPYLLLEVSSYFSELGHGTAELQQSAREACAAVTEAHCFAADCWEQAAVLARGRGDYNGFIYYSGAAFWRRQSIALLNGCEPQEIPNLKLNGCEQVLYRFSPAWFTSNCYGVATFKRSTSYPIGVEAIREAPQDRERLDTVEWLLSSGLGKGVRAVGLVRRGGRFDTAAAVNVTFDCWECHRLYVGITNPELLIA